MGEKRFGWSRSSRFSNFNDLRTGRIAATAPTVPWREWKLDKTFFQALSRYTLDHPETTLPHVLDNIIKGLEANQDLFLLIPNAPFPACGLIQALAHLVKLGVVCNDVLCHPDAGYNFSSPTG